jgi:hypothetical protein
MYKVHCFGNSHVDMFKGNNKMWEPSTHPIFTTHGLGPTTAYSFYTKYHSRILEILNNETVDKDKDFLMLVVGEVDCRWHIPLQAQKQNRDLDDIIGECIDRYFDSLLDLKRMGYKLICWGAHPSTTKGHCDNLNAPIFGDCLFRNDIARRWNIQLNNKCSENGVLFFTLFDELILPSGMTDMRFYNDYCHLNGVKVAPLIRERIPIALDAIIKSEI